jgi:probable HAF family extracellular repeat protein
VRSLFIAAVATVAVSWVAQLQGDAGASGKRWVTRDLGTLGGRQSWASAITEDGQIVGRSEVKPSSGRTAWHAFLWQNGKMRDLGTLGGPTSEAIAINERGEVIGMSTTASGARRAFLWRTGNMVDLGVLGEPPAGVLRQRVPETEAVAINDRGQVVGTSWTARGVRHAFMWGHDRMRDLGALGSGQSSAKAINNDGQVVGSSRTREGPHAFLWENGRIAGYGSPGYPQRTDAQALLWDGNTHDLGTLGGPESQATAINERGLVVGWSHTLPCHRPVAHPERTCGTHAFVWQNGRLSDLRTLGGKTSEAAAIADNGQIVGSSLTRTRPRNSSVHHAVLWTT